MFAKKLEKQISEAELIPIVSLLNEDVVETPGNCSICFPFIFHNLLWEHDQLDLKSANFMFDNQNGN